MSRTGIFCFLILCGTFNGLYAQVNITTPNSNILFVLDASGSMRGQWNGNSKFELAKEILSTTIDSVTRSNPKVQFALRVFGHQSPRNANDCKDTRLEVPFSKKNALLIGEKLKQIHPQGQTPITYALSQSPGDFPKDSSSINAIVLITDGNETCGGDFCSLSTLFEQKHITLRPFIVGLGLSDSLKKKFECLGNVFNVQNEDAFTRTMRIVISRVLNPTTCQVNLLDAYGNPTETNVAFTLYDHATGAVRYQLMHTLGISGTPDTLQLDPRYTYDLQVHSIPEVWKEDIHLVAGTHNLIAVQVPMGTLDIRIDGVTGNFSTVPCIVRRAGKPTILFVQDANTTQRYLTGEYDLEILTLPRTLIAGVRVEEAKSNIIKIQRTGTLLITPSEAGVASVFAVEEKSWVKVYDFNSIKSQKTLKLQPGNYWVVYRPDKYRQAVRTKQVPVTIAAGKTNSVRL